MVRVMTQQRCANPACDPGVEIERNRERDNRVIEEPTKGSGSGCRVVLSGQMLANALGTLGRVD